MKLNIAYNMATHIAAAVIIMIDSLSMALTFNFAFFFGTETTQTL